MTYVFTSKYISPFFDFRPLLLISPKYHSGTICLTDFQNVEVLDEVKYFCSQKSFLLRFDIRELLPLLFNKRNKRIKWGLTIRVKESTRIYYHYNYSSHNDVGIGSVCEFLLTKTIVLLVRSLTSI